VQTDALSVAARLSIMPCILEMLWCVQVIA